MAHYNLEDFRKASSVLKKLVKRDGKNARGWNALGATFMAMEKYRAARESFERAVGLDANLSDAHYNLAQVIRIADPKEKDLARQHYQASLTLGSGVDADMESYLQAN